MKKFLSLLSMTVLLALASCGGNASSSSSEAPLDSSSSHEGSSSSSNESLPSSEPSSTEESSEPSSEPSSSAGEDLPYYASIDWSLTGASLKTALFQLINPHTNIGYDGLKAAYEVTDADEEGYLVDIYSVEKQYSAKWDYHDYSKEGDTYNREHIIPQTFFGKDSGGPIYSDLYNVYPTDGYVNQRRSNYPHGQVGEATYTSNNGSKLGTSSYEGYSGTVFEPIDKWKGDIARSYFYSVTCYQENVPNWNSYDQLAKNTYPSLSSWTVSLFLEWHDLDPVDEWEKGRNERVYGYQKNRNPFIDHPEAAHAIWDSAY